MALSPPSWPTTDAADARLFEIAHEAGYSPMDVLNAWPDVAADLPGYPTEDEQREAARCKVLIALCSGDEDATNWIRLCAAPLNEFRDQLRDSRGGSRL